MFFNLITYNILYQFLKNINGRKCCLMSRGKKNKKPLKRCEGGGALIVLLAVLTRYGDVTPNRTIFYMMI